MIWCYPDQKGLGDIKYSDFSGRGMYPRNVRGVDRTDLTQGESDSSA